MAEEWAAASLSCDIARCASTDPYGYPVLHFGTKEQHEKFLKPVISGEKIMQILEGIGYTKEYPVERYYRDARVGQITAGSTEIQRFIIQREIYRALGYK